MAWISTRKTQWILKIKVSLTQILQIEQNYIPAQAFMIFFRGPIVYINPTRIPARCPAKEVLQKWKILWMMERKTFFFVGIQNGDCRICCNRESPWVRPSDLRDLREVICFQGCSAKFSFFITILKLVGIDSYIKALKNILKKLEITWKDHFNCLFKGQNTISLKAFKDLLK